MKRISAHATLALLLLCISEAAVAQDKATGPRDLVVEQPAPAGQQHRPHHHVLRPVQVSLMPIGPSTLAIGQPLRFRMVATTNGFGSLYVLSASGRTQLWLENVRLRAGRPISYPRAGNIVRAAAPAGDETIVFVASRNRIDGFAGTGATTAPLDLQYTHEGFRAALHKSSARPPRRLGLRRTYRARARLKRLSDRMETFAREEVRPSISNRGKSAKTRGTSQCVMRNTRSSARSLCSPSRPSPTPPICAI